MNKRDDPTQESLKSMLSYDNETGVFQWIEVRRGRNLGRPVGCVNGDGYLQVSISGRLYSAHRLAWLYVYGAFPRYVIDHIDGDKTNNRIANLRDVSWTTNRENLRRASSNNKSTGLLGASLHIGTGKYVAQIKSKGTPYYLGQFSTPEEAHQVYLEAKRQLHKGNTL